MKLTIHIFLVALFFLCACGNTANNKKVDSPSISNSPEDAINFIQNAICTHYMTEFKRHNTDTPAMVMVVDSNHHDSEFAFLNGIELRETPPGDPMLGAINVIPFPKDYIKGDLNGDGKEDYVIPVYVTGGGNVEWREIFVFVSNATGVHFAKMLSSFELAHCGGREGSGGQFFPKSIVNGILKGEAFCYQESDPHCCPSIKNEVEYKFDTGFVLVKQTLIK